MKILKDWQNKDFSVYEVKDLEGMKALIAKATQIVEDTIVNEKITDSGTCVLACGIVIKLLPKGARKNYVNHIIVGQPFQGNISNSRALRHAVEFLRASGIECRYDDGRMD